MEKILNTYYAKNAKKLHTMVDKILFKLRFHDVDNEDFYSLANEVFVDVLKRYDGKQDFDGFLYSCLYRKFCTEMTRRNRQKRQADKMALSWETPIGEDDRSSTLGDMIASNIDIEKEILGDDSDIIMDEKIERYLKSLSKIQRKIIEMKMQNVEVQHIKEELGLTDNQYSSHMQEVVQYEHIRLLHI
jgi:RNA polymerase sigma factor (sigma-70 family)